MSGPIPPPCDRARIRAGTADAVCARRTGRWVLVATIVGSSMAFIDSTVVNVALPVMQADLNATVAGAQWIVESYALLLTALILTGGALGDRYGRRRIYGLGIVLFAVASAWCGLAPSIGQLVAARAVQGLGAALLIPTSLALITASFEPERRGRAIGTWSAFSAMTMALGPVLGGWLVEHISWRAVFFINLPLAAGVLAVIFSRVPESRQRDGNAGLDWRGALLVTLGLGGVVYALIESPGHGFGHPAIAGSLAAGLVLLAAFLAVEARSRAPMMPPGLFRGRAFSGANLLTLLLYGALSVVLFFLPFNLLHVQGYSATATGLAVLPFSLCVTLLSRWSGGLADRFGARVPLVAGPLVAAAGMALFAVPGIGGGYWTTFFPAVLLLGIGMGLTAAPLTTAVLGAVRDAQTGMASGINNAVARLAGLLAIALLGIVMLSVFGGRLDDRLAGMNLPAAMVRSLAEQRTQLAAATLPKGTEPELQASLQSAVDEAFVAGFRRVMLLCAGMGLVAAVTAAVSLGGKKRESAPEQEQGSDGP